MRIFSRGPNQLGPLDGLRAIAILWVLSFHAAWYSIRYIPPETYVRMLRAPFLLVVWRGDFGVDLFFVLSGFLIAGMLLDEQARDSRVRIGRFYWRRLLRLSPALAVALTLDQLVLHDWPGNAWAVLAFVSNFVSVWHVCMAWTWSLSIEAQFYFVAPWLMRVVGARAQATQIAVCVGLLFLACAVSAFVAARGDFHPPDVEIVITRRPSQWVRAFDALYTKPWMRVGPILAGVLAALLYRRPAVMRTLAQARVVGTLGLAMAIVLAATMTHWPLFDGAPRAIELAYLGCFRPLFGLAVAYVLLLSLSEHCLGRSLCRALSARPFIPIAYLAYGAYLLNPIVVMVLHPMLVRWATAWSVPPIALFLPVDVVCTLLAAIPLHLLVERPAMALRPRQTG